MTDPQWCQDATDVIEDFKETLTVHRKSVAYSASAQGVITWVLQGTFEGDWQPMSGEAMRKEDGLGIRSKAMIIAACDIDVENDDRITRADGTFEYVNYVKIFHGHTTIFVKRKKGSR